MIVPVILCGGSGTRLWPLSRRNYAKQNVPVLGGESPFQRTLRRLAGRPGFERPVVITGSEARFMASDQAREVGVEIDIVLEPAGRDTLAAVALATLVVSRRNPDATVLVLPSDHLIPDADAFVAAALRAEAAAADGKLVIFGLKPSAPSSAYGYIRAGAPIRSGAEARAVDGFEEKPTRERAEALIAEGCLWNAGMLCFRAEACLEEIGSLAPGTLAEVEASLEESEIDLGALRAGPSFARAPRISFDHGVMEKTARAAVLPVDFAWSDIGDWREVWSLSEKDDAGVATEGTTVLMDVRDSYIRADGRLVCAIGVEGLLVVDTSDALLVASLDRAQDVKTLVARLEAEGRPESHTPARVYRPWGWYQTMDLGTRFRVKRIQVSPGKQLSLQRHHHRSEHWVVVSGTAEVTRDDETRIVRENESIYLPLGCLHRLANPGKIPVEIVEVQTGSYLEEDDIVRVQDDFGRS